MNKDAKKEQDQNLALYTKYRPQKFSDVLGQEQVTNVLQSAVKLGNVAHAYLFSGSRGTGKTSVARILAREIGTTEKDLYEIDAASNNGVEEIRALNEAVLSMPFDSKYKVYILDEVHMLSNSAFNALLKTLEEPPRHVIFILATTEPHKLPDTVVSRCESYSFKAPSRAILKKLATNTAKNEGRELDPAAAELISILGDGSFRDTHTTLQKLIRSTDSKKLEVEDVEKVSGAPQTQLVNDLLEAIALPDLEKGNEAIATLKERNIDIKVLLKLLLERLRMALLLKVSPNKEKEFSKDFGEDEVKSIAKLVSGDGGDNGDSEAGNGVAKNLNARTLIQLLEVYEKSLRSPLPFLPLELLLIDFTAEKG
jgi:DNA polymerase-3 subunit gamma/tau